ncbi:MAG: hypothetical protein AAF928_01010 [Myxococcota bacterium]
MNPRDRETLIEETTSAWRPQRPDGALGPHPSFADLDEDGRREAFARTRALRALEAALDAQGLSTTSRAVLRRIRGARSE